MEVFKTNKGLQYIYEQESGYVSLAPKSFSNHVKGIVDNQYYAGKLKYLSSYGVISLDNSLRSTYKFLTKEDIKLAILNTHQIIFEVTDRCNLCCHYCGYGELYDNYDERSNLNMSFDMFKILYDYLKSIWEVSKEQGSTYLRISFYGGEPLCNFSFIEQAVKYANVNPIANKKIIFSMTTNAILLKKYMDFLVANSFELLVSLDGDKYNDSYRKYKNGDNSFDIVTNNLDNLKHYYPDYFEKKVKFNSVLHDRNSIKEADDFIYRKYHKHPMTNELNVFGVANNKKQEFQKMFHSKSEEFRQMPRLDKVLYTHHSPFLMEYEKWILGTSLVSYSANIENVLSSNLVSNRIFANKELPTRTCIPFSRKIFVSVKGKLYPCERIGNQFDFGSITSDSVLFDYKKILTTYNGLYKKYVRFCTRCKNKDFCSVCIASDIDGYEVCKLRYNIENNKISEMVSYFEQNPDVIEDTFKNITVL